MKILNDPRLRLYELTYLVSTSQTEADLKSFQEDLNKLISKHSGKVLSTESWGKRPLAYSLKKNGTKHYEANYFHLVIEFSPNKSVSFEKELYLEERILRHLLVVADEQDSSKLAKPKSDKVEEKVEAKS